MLITLNDAANPPRQVEIELPFYRTIDTSNDRFEVNWYTKVEEREGQLRHHEICINGITGINIQVIENFSFNGVTGDFILAESGYRVSDEAEFAWALRKVREILEDMGG